MKYLIIAMLFIASKVYGQDTTRIPGIEVGPGLKIIHGEVADTIYVDTLRPDYGTNVRLHWYEPIDTIPCKMLVSDRTGVYMVDGYETQKYYWDHIEYLDANKQPLNKDIIVWQSRYRDQ